MSNDPNNEQFSFFSPQKCGTKNIPASNNMINDIWIIMTKVVFIVLKEGSESAAVRCTLSFWIRLPTDVVSAKSSFTGVMASKENPYCLIFIKETKKKIQF